MSANASTPMVGSPRTEGVRGRIDGALVALAEKVGARMEASTIYGDPVERDGVTVIPVASARFGLGGGGGSDPAKGQEGDGAGVGATVTPAGYIELKDGASRFVPIVHPGRMVLAALLGVAAVLTAVARVTAVRGGGRSRRGR